MYDIRTTFLGVLFAGVGLVASLGAAGCGEETVKGSQDTLDSRLVCEGSSCRVPAGNYTDDMTWTADKTYTLGGKVFIGDGTSANAATLTIEAGTLVVADSSAKAYLAILPSSKIIARGTAEKPIVFTSDKVPGERKRGDWGGIIISGNAPVNCGGSATTCLGEGETGAYGGTNPNDDSGVLEYVRVEFAGNQVTAEDELNGFAFQGVGAGTKVSHIHAHKTQDDGVEFFGGTVNVDHVVITGAADDSLDWTFGWSGTARYVLIQQHDDESDNGIEADNNDKDHNALPRSNPVVEYITLIGSPSSSKSDVGVLLRHGTNGTIRHAIVASFNEAAVDIDSASTFLEAGGAAGAPTGKLKFESSMIFAEGSAKTIRDRSASDVTKDLDKARAAAEQKGETCGAPTDKADGGKELVCGTTKTTIEPADPWVASSFIMGQPGVLVADPQLVDPFNKTQPNFVARNGQAASMGGLAGGADWTGGWTAYPAN